MEPITSPISGAKIRLLRENAGLTQEELAEKCPVNAASISNIERGVFQPRVKTAHAIAAALGVTVADLRESVGVA